ncbi:ergothioneine biosynthesis protein EgtB [Algoriphagus ratkowskyi]|uniref:Ergothioneine biosynthesis protein EgtB n=1 Tax=Algoriphagus ratkowskyi TaxID=57028 RepID=A0A2W7R4G7_9BACT|nr:ergothioneine biosynthesis protein EgtB [Algoriphagus ratkowskyi]PZX55384.1 ergothioneine biosynthesis protein EgtB [Algoriphagus ratkowskyi]TXD79688.1 ergothioneine biosynthesis protein EgtB [Algoriphagus ratkowskyi]
MSLVEAYQRVRNHSLNLCKNLITEDYSLQASEEVSPPKWHLAHTTWFFEQFILLPNDSTYEVKHPQFNFLFNSYYNSLGARTARNQRGLMSRPSVDEVKIYRAYVDEAMSNLIQKNILELSELVILGMNHEQQHQELLLSDLKYNLWFNPLNPSVMDISEYTPETESVWISVNGGVFEIGFKGDGFCYDNELNAHKVYVQDFEISSALVTNGEYLEFMNAGGYDEPKYWHDEGWAWTKDLIVKAPLYWETKNQDWHYYTLEGLKPVDKESAVAHVNFYEASAFAAWKGMRLPTEFEWEVAQDQFDWGKRWEWTNSAYLAYPGFTVAEGALGEYNGKFMINQMVLRGASVATSPEHSRPTYRNFFHPKHRWQFMGIRLAKSI